MKTFLFLALALLGSAMSASGQNETIDSLRSLVKSAYTSMEQKNYRKATALFNEAIALSARENDTEVPPALKRAVYGDAYYNLACIYSLSERKSAALNALSKAIDEGGFRDYAWALKDSDLRNIQHETAFKNMIRELKEKYDYPALLKSAGKYRSDARNADRPAFTYLSPEDPRLVHLRRTLRLDSIAGNGDEISKIKNLCLWAHNAVRHDGGSSNPPEKNALALLQVCREQNRGINCRMMATLLNECYLALGFKSRFVTCLPKDENDPDCHVVNVVWSDTMDQWIMVDPTFYAFLSDRDGRLLGIEQARKMIVEGQTVRLNPEANWNGQKKSQQDYLNYMSKNFYWFQCPQNSTYDTESQGKRDNTRYIALAPGDFQPWMDSDHLSRDENYFWARPE